MALGLLGVGIGVHYERGRAAGEQKNPDAAIQLLSRTGSPPADSWRPAMVLTGPGVAPEPEPAPAGTDLRALAGKAAAGSRWQQIPPELRTRLAARPGAIARVEVQWSRTAGGDAAALDLYHTRTLSQAGGVPCDFVVGNGRRSTDGGIETTRHWAARNGTGDTAISICLVGHGPDLTPAQETALGELITCIEAGHGHVALAMQHPGAPGLLADAGEN